MTICPAHNHTDMRKKASTLNFQLPASGKSSQLERDQVTHHLRRLCHGALRAARCRRWDSAGPRRAAGHAPRALPPSAGPHSHTCAPMTRAAPCMHPNVSQEDLLCRLEHWFHLWIEKSPSAVMWAANNALQIPVPFAQCQVSRRHGNPGWHYPSSNDIIEGKVADHLEV